MQIDFSDKRVIAATATAGIVVAVIIVLQSLILWGRSSPAAVTYAPTQQAAPQQETAAQKCVRRGGVQVNGICEPVRRTQGTFGTINNPSCPEAVEDAQGRCVPCKEVDPGTYYSEVAHGCINFGQLTAQDQRNLDALSEARFKGR